jgi:anhydro-N-acetylmuramic acid kinase
VNELRSKFERSEALVAGVLSGTSGDGIDVALTRMGLDAHGALAPPTLLAFETRPFSRELAPRVRAVLDGSPVSLRECALMTRDLGRAFGDAAAGVAAAHGIALDLVGSHGQTVYHHDGAESSGAATLQLGDGDFVAESSNAWVVSDFRQRDIAAGGEGAPVSILADDLVFARAPRPCAVLNLGGMGNLSLLDARGSVRAFDTGPANSLLDGLARRFLGQSFDAGGASAARGTPHADVVAALLQHPFFEKPPPKSTGRDTFGAHWVDEVVALCRARGILDGARGPCDLMATAVDLVAASIALALERHVAVRPERLFVAGGGAHNATLVRAISRRTGVPVDASDAVGVPVDAREALVFAVLAARCVLGVPVTHPAATGARAGRVLGKISPGRGA